MRDFFEELKEIGFTEEELNREREPIQQYRPFEIFSMKEYNNIHYSLTTEICPIQQNAELD